MIPPAARARLRKIKRYRVYRLLDVPRRALVIWRFHRSHLARALEWIFVAREDTNFTYDIEPVSRTYLASAVSLATGVPAAAVSDYFDEAERDEELRETIRAAVAASRFRHIARAEPLFGRRLAWYALARITRPRVIVETGVDKGLGSILLCAALRRNAAEGAPGRYYGTDTNPDAGWLLQQPYAAFGTVLYGDSIASLRAFAGEIDLFVNDSDHSLEYEAGEYRTIEHKLAAGAIVVADNAHVSEELARFAERTGRGFAFVAEKPKGHWYPGDGVGLCFPHQRRRARSAGQS